MEVKIDSHSGLYKDTNSNSVVSEKNSKEYLDYKLRRSNMKNINNIIKDISFLKDEISKINQKIKDIEVSNVN
jgi:hypothetical protein